MPLRHERETPSGPIKLNVGKIRVLVDANYGRTWESPTYGRRARSLD